ncbi:MAG: pyruvate:ferredoxin (flavodoxin) oxidoreductase [Spirochaetes bacterium]|nr:pyruvate:ferredoxin (flavodoxin) oxidoreductase [Spirochaetota bacterium]
MKRRKQTIDGNAAAAHVSYAFSEVAAIYPITPSSQMADLADQWAAAGRKNLFGRPVRVVEMQSEGGAAGAVHGSLQAGALTTTYTAAQGLLLMIPNMHRISGELLPAVFHVSARALANNAWSVFGDHQDVMAVRQTGFAMLASSSVQDVMNLSAVAHLAAIKARLPFLHFFDGFRTSHEVQKIEVLEYEELDKLLDRDAVKAFRDRALSPDHPIHRGMTQNPDVFFQMREAVNPWYAALPATIDYYMEEINKLTGRDYKFFNYYGAPDAQRVIVAMGSACTSIEETIDWMNARGEKVGLVNVRLYRPFLPERLLSVLPPSVKKIAVLDRTKDLYQSGMATEPLYTDVRGAFYDAAAAGKPVPAVVGGRYGLGGKNFSPADILAVYQNLAQERPKNGFTLSIEDDVTHTSLPQPEKFDPTPAGTTACKFWGFGSDGTVGANRNAIAIIGDHTDLYAQGYFAFDSKKSGGITISHLRFGKQPIKSSYYIQNADFIACHNQAYVGRYDLLEGLKPGGRFLLNTLWDAAGLEAHLPADMKRFIAGNEIEFYTLNAVSIAQELGLGGRINMIMQAAFFKITGIVPIEDAVAHLKDAVKDTYGKQGQSVIDMNFASIDRGIADIVKVAVPESWKNATAVATAVATATAEKPPAPAFIAGFVEPVNNQKGDLLPVSVFKGCEDGSFPLGTSAFEKRGIAIEVPVWNAAGCVQCNRCSFVCPHSAIRPLLAEAGELAGAPAGFQTKAATGFDGKLYHLSISPLDCMGCANCLDVCPAKGAALEMKPLASQLPAGAEKWDFAAANISYKKLPEKQLRSVKGSQFARPLLEFSGACAGCGETPYVKLLTQLFGDRLYIQNPSGCSTVWGGSSPNIPYTANAQGQGPAFAYSLFEDCGEYGFGIHLGATEVRGLLADKVKAALSGAGRLPPDLREALEDWHSKMEMSEGTRERGANLTRALEAHKGSDVLLNEIYERRDFFARKAQWIVGGDGWAYDIGYGGLDHVAASGEDLNILVLDTEIYSNTGGQSSKATPLAAIAGFNASGKKTGKKDLGLMMIPYGNIYVAQIAMGADPNQTLQAMLEAEAHPGVSILIAYCPCIGHGPVAGMAETQSQQKRAVDAGYWGLYRYNPQLKAQGKNPFSMDSAPPQASFQDFLKSEVRYAALLRQFPESAQELFDKCERHAMERLAAYRRLAGL